MIATDKLRGLIAEKGLTQAEVARNLDIAPKTFYEKMKKGIFWSYEMDKLIEMLDIKDPTKYFFKK